MWFRRIFWFYDGCINWVRDCSGLDSYKWQWNRSVSYSGNQLSWQQWPSSFYLYVLFTRPEFDSLSWLHNQLKLNLLLSLFGHLLTVTEGGSACENSSMIFINKLVELPSTICYINRKVSKVTFVPISLFQLWKIFFLLLIFSFNV